MRTVLTKIAGTVSTHRVLKSHQPHKQLQVTQLQVHLFVLYVTWTTRKLITAQHSIYRNLYMLDRESFLLSISFMLHTNH